MRVYAPHPSDCPDDEFFARVAALEDQGRAPFDAGALALLADLSRRLLALPRAEAAPQLTALGFWLRPAALEPLRSHVAPEGDALAAPRGTALHLPPANVDTLFGYSWALSVLAGNANVVRLPARLGPVAETLMDCIGAALQAAGDAHRHLFCWYPADDANTNARLSALADVRLVWGGDAKVEALGRVPVRPGGLSLGFPDRFSYAAIAAEAYDSLPPAERDALAERLFNDVFWFGQMGCASPHVLYWVGGPASYHDLLERLDHAAAGRVPAETGTALAKMSLIYELAADQAIGGATWHANALVSVAAGPDLDLRGRAVGGGLIAVVPVDGLEAVASQVRRRDQTLTHFGFDRATLLDFAARTAARGLSRLVPVGDALGFDAVWDGTDLLRALTRRVIVRETPPRRP